MKKARPAYLRVGVTGGIGSGKSTVCRHFETLGRTVLSADAIARTLTEEHKEIKAAIRRTFGEEVFASEGSLNRQKLAARVFSDPVELHKLNAIVHPHVFDYIERQLEVLPLEKKKPYVVIEAALIFESGMDERVDAVLVVHADEETRIARVMQRDGVTREEVLARMRFQMDVKDALERAHFVLHNDGTEAELLPRVQFIDALLKKL